MLRKRLLLERGWPWLLLTLLVGGGMVGLVVMVVDGTISDPWGQHARGYTLTGIILGFLTASMGLLVFFYSLRKRSLQEVVKGGGGTMMTWLWLHVTVGILTMLGALAHAGFGAISLPTSSGKVLLWVLIALTLSGIIWRLVYWTVPKGAAKKIGNFSEEGMVAHAKTLTTEIEKIVAGKSDHFHQLKQWLEAAPRSEQEVAQAAHGMSEEDRSDLLAIHGMLASRQRAHQRRSLQGKYTRRLQWWRVLHVPLSLAIVPLLIAHVVGALRVPTRMMPMGEAPSQSVSGIVRSKECRSCHKRIYDQWKYSMHAHGMTSPIMIVQNNRVIREELKEAKSPDPKLVCINCHGPLGVALTRQEQATLPLERDGFEKALLNEGVSCTVCHQMRTDESTPGRAGLASFQNDYDPVGNTYYGPYGDPVGNSYHQSGSMPLFENPEKVCVNCHNVVYDLDGDGKVEKGVDLILQETTEEYFEYREAGGPGSCAGCHMPIDRKRKRIAERALYYLEQDGHAPERVVHDHTFVGVDYPLDVVDDKDPQRKKRQALLKKGPLLDLSFDNDQLTVSIENKGAGHNMPTGLAFVRQMWLEVKVTDSQGVLVFSSGVLKDDNDDLCDSFTLERDPNSLAKFVRGCEDGADEFLVNFQQFLVNRIDTERDEGGRPVKNEDEELIVVAHEDATEQVIQRLKGGAVPRVRPFDKKKLAPIPPFESRSFAYPLPANSAKISVRLLFRSFPPYFLRGLDAGREKGEPNLIKLIKNLQIEVMAERELKL